MASRVTRLAQVVMVAVKRIIAVELTQLALYEYHEYYRGGVGGLN